jgi:hypothetical protein
LISHSLERLLESKCPQGINQQTLAKGVRQLKKEFNEGHRGKFDGNGPDGKMGPYRLSNPWPWIIAGDIEISCEEIASCFDPVVQSVVDGIRRNLANNDQPYDHLVLNGGLFASTYVMNTIKREFGHLKITRMSAQ